MIDADRARYAGADLAVVPLLLIAEEDVAVVDLAIDGDDIDGADAAFAALAIRYHLEAGAVQRVEHRAVVRHHELGVRILQPHAEFRRRHQAAGAEGFVAQICGRSSSIVPGAPRGLQHPHRAAHHGDGIVRQGAEGGVQIDPRAFIGGMHDQPIAEHCRQFVEERGVAARFHRIVQGRGRYSGGAGRRR